ncbi:hypothetical protein [Bosea sp. AAP35]|uniref:hypothetical protein n=1 Tax=Bosea sp. AAP35 TaxID=1523417 RepID=UPI0006B8C4D7|nr:hypothetical protein [Bosea sp. AAP35]
MVKRVLGSLSSLVAEAQRKGLVAANHVKAGGRTKRGKRDQSHIEMPTRDELKAMLAATTDKTRPLIMVALLCGLRGSELRGLLWSLEPAVTRAGKPCSPKLRPAVAHAGLLQTEPCLGRLALVIAGLLVWRRPYGMTVLSDN